ncbi:MAG TPA: MMPL family transporter [Polyangia bacterium]|nr:MMPL family transporter [Polyangia bacterium]
MASPSDRDPSSLTRSYVGWTLRHGRLLWTLALMLAIPAAWRTASLYRNLRSEVEELLPRDAPSVIAIQELRARMAGLQYLGVVVGIDARAGGRLADGERLVDDLAARVRAYPPELVSAVRVGYAPERAFVEKHAAMLLQLADLQMIRQRIEDRIHWEYGQETGTLLDDSEPAPSVDFSDIEDKYRAEVSGPELENGRFSSATLGTTLMLVEVGGFSTSAARAAELIRRVTADIAALGGPGHYGSGLRVGFSGDVAISAEEMAALVEDLTISFVLVGAAVLLALVVFYGWRRAVPALFLPLFVGATYAFALASLRPFGVTELNSNTAFLGSIIVGNGVNFGIIQLARYVEERRLGVPIERALEVALDATRKGTLSAALAAGVAYASLVAMQFRGFRQFGIIGGLGMVFVWATTFVLGPSLIAWLDGGKLAAGRSTPRRRVLMTRVARFVVARPRAILLGAALVTIVAGWQLRRFSDASLEYDFSHLRRRDTWASGEGFWGKKMDALLGRYLTPTALLTDSVAEARAVAAKLRDSLRAAPTVSAPALASMVASVRTYDDLLPPNQEAKAEEIEAIRHKMTPKVRAHMSREDARRLDDLLGAHRPVPVTDAELPLALATGLRERDGNRGRVVLVFPNPAQSWWRRETIDGFVRALRDAAQAPVALGGRPARVAGGPPLTSDIIESMRRDGPLASLLAFLGVVATVILIFRRGLATPFVIGALLVGVAWMLGATLGLGIKINFVNFIAFPITFGIGVDYAVNVMARYLRDGSRDVEAAVRETGGAVGLCSLTTIIGYSSLLVAQNVGLFLFGVLAVLGELTCLTTAVIVLPAVLRLFRRGTTSGIELKRGTARDAGVGQEGVHGGGALGGEDVSSSL